MSRTFKDKPSKFKFDPWDKDRLMTDIWSFRQLPTTKTKKRKEVDCEDHWMTKPGWWTKMWMTRPERRAAHLQEVATLKALDLEEVDFPNKGRKPHIYYW